MADHSYHYDVLIVGAGNAACSAAHAALEKGAKVGILEKAQQRERGGNSALTGHMRFVFNGLEDIRSLVRGTSDDELRALLERMPKRTEDMLWDEVMRVTDNQSDQEMLQVHVTESLPTVQWLASKGHDWVPAGGFNMPSDNILLMNGGGYGLQQRNFAILERDGAAFHYGTAASELIRDGKGHVIGVRALAPDGFANFHAKSVVLACGSFEANPEMRARYLGPGWDMIHIRGVPFNTGDGLRMALDIGAMPHGSWTTCHASPQDIALPPFTIPVSYTTKRSYARYMYPYSIMVNTNGERFMDEGEDLRGRTYAKTGRAILAQPGGVAFQILDAKARTLDLYPTNYATATAAKADTLEKLGEELGINVPNFIRTVREFNAAIQPGTFNPDRHRLDGKCTAGITPKKSNYAMPIEEPPFEAFPVRCGMTFTYGGLRIDPTSAQVQHVAGRPIGGLYAAGEMAGGLWVGNYASGSGMMAGATFGRIAGTHAAATAWHDPPTAADRTAPSEIP
jgi:tricarballylate dehydrogenase